MPTRTPTAASSATRDEPSQHTLGVLLKDTALVIRENCAPGPPRASPASPRSGSITDLPDIKKEKQKIRKNEVTEEYVPDKEQNKIPEGELSEMRQAIYLMEFEVMIVKMLNEFRKRMDEQ